jgi:hypothetical protein
MGVMMGAKARGRFTRACDVFSRASARLKGRRSGLGDIERLADITARMPKIACGKRGELRGKLAFAP